MVSSTHLSEGRKRNLWLREGREDEYRINRTISRTTYQFRDHEGEGGVRKNLTKCNSRTLYIRWQLLKVSYVFHCLPILMVGGGGAENFAERE